MTVLENATDTFFYPVLFTQPLVNIKPMPIIAGGLAEFFNYTIAGDAAGVSYFTPVGLKYSVMASVAVIVIVTFIAIVLLEPVGLSKAVDLPIFRSIMTCYTSIIKTEKTAQPAFFKSLDRFTRERLITVSQGRTTLVLLTGGLLMKGLEKVFRLTELPITSYY